VASGASASCGISRKEPNMPKPTNRVARLVIATGGSVKPDVHQRLGGA
jgi:hypothetical protein